MLRQAPERNRLTFSSTIYPPAKKKASTSPSASSSTSTSFAASSSSAASTEPNSPAYSSFVEIELQVEVEPVVSHIVYDEEREEDMATNLRTWFKERQCKRAFEFIIVIHSPNKKP